MCTNRIRQLLYADTRNYFIFTRHLQKSLIEYVVFICTYKCWNIPHDMQDIELILFNGVVWKKDVVKLEIVEMVTHHSHHFICFHVVHVENVEVVEAVVERLGNLKLEVHHAVEDTDLLELDHAHEVV